MSTPWLKATLQGQLDPAAGPSQKGQDVFCQPQPQCHPQCLHLAMTYAVTGLSPARGILPWRNWLKPPDGAGTLTLSLRREGQVGHTPSLSFPAEVEPQDLNILLADATVYIHSMKPWFHYIVLYIYKVLPYPQSLLHPCRTVGIKVGRAGIVSPL